MTHLSFSKNITVRHIEADGKQFFCYSSKKLNMSRSKRYCGLKWWKSCFSSTNDVYLRNSLYMMCIWVTCFTVGNKMVSNSGYTRIIKFRYPNWLLPGISWIHEFALDYMHLVCLGVVRRMLHFMPNTCKLSFQQRSRISDNLKSLNGKLPREFAGTW